MKSYHINYKLLQELYPTQEIPSHQLTPLHNGSVKNIYSYQDDLVFIFSDQFSAFDWGRMPDMIPYKGEALLASSVCLFYFLNDYNFNSIIKKHQLNPSNLKDFQIKNHLKGIVRVFDEHDDELWGLQVKKVQVPQIINDSYQYYQSSPTDCLLPLECIIRHELTPESSVWERKEFFDDHQLKCEPYQNFVLKPSLLDWSTKLENKDRYLTAQQAKVLAGLSSEEWQLLKNQTTLVGYALKELFQQCGYQFIDAKFEWGIGPSSNSKTRSFFLVDSIGPDEMRLVKNQQDISKEILRKWYRDTDWYKQLKSFQSTKKTTWKQDMLDQHLYPPNLPKEIISECSQSYIQFCNQISEYLFEKPIFEPIPKLKEIHR